MSAETAPLRAVPGRLWYYLIARLLDTAATAGLVTIIGKQIFDMATRQGASEERVLFLLGVLGIVQFVPTFVFSPFAGSIENVRTWGWFFWIRYSTSPEGCRCSSVGRTLVGRLSRQVRRPVDLSRS